MSTRRSFLQNITTASLGLPLVSLQSSPLFSALAGCTAEGPQLRVAILGLGSYAKRVADAMKDCKRAKLVGLISGTPAKVKEWQKEYNVPDQNCYNYDNFDNIKNNPNIDAVYIITPNALHMPQTLRVARAGKQCI